jgi:hypothetical protein
MLQYPKLLEMSIHLAWLALGWCGGESRRVMLVGVALLCAVSACKRESGHGRRPVERQALARGDHVVVEATAARFYEAQVLEVNGDQLRVQSSEAPGSVLVPASNAYRLPPADCTFDSQAPVVCSPRPGKWVACQVRRSDPDAVEVTTVEGDRHRLSCQAVLVPSGLTALNLRRSLERAAARDRFLAAVARAGRPGAREGWKPAPREHVLGQRAAAWYSAAIHELEDDRVFVRWDADGRISEIGLLDVVPDPPYEPPPVRGQHALLRPSSTGQAWTPVRVEFVDADAFSVLDVEGQRRTVPARDLVPLR